MTTRTRCLRALALIAAAAGVGSVCAHSRTPHTGAPIAPDAPQALVEAAREQLPATGPSKTGTSQAADVPAPASKVRPTDDQLLERVRALVGADEATSRRALIALFDELFTVQEGRNAEVARPFEGRWTLPQEFSVNLLDRILPLLDEVHPVDPPDDDMKFLLMALEVLQRMRYAPALSALLREEGVPALGEMTPWSWSRFGVAAVQPLAERVRTGTDRARAQALVALREVQDPAALPLLTELAAKDANADLRAAATQAIRRTGKASLPVGLATDMNRFRDVVLSTQAAFGERREAVLALAANGTAGDLDFLLRNVQGVLAMSPPRPQDAVDVAAEAVRALVERDDPKAVAWVLSFVQSRGLDAQANEEIRNHAIEDLGLFSLRAAEPVLVAVMNDESDDLRSRWWAASALARIDPDHEADYVRRAAELDERWQSTARLGGK